MLLGRDDEAQLLFEWYYPEETPDGLWFRWTDDLAALALVAKRSDRGVEVTSCFPEDGREAFVHVLHPDAGWVFHWPAAVGAAVPLDRIELDASLPEGLVQLILQTPKPYRESHGGGRFLGVATHRCRVMSYSTEHFHWAERGGRAGAGEWIDWP